ncbi:hypothetical protein [Brachybacterium sp. GPGPB12]|uniref:hypothetical protein n=1 Tax=Brachybacterium sp. GPGPB12 TaxID=3023517 RepID=UPI0031342BD5
MPAHPADRGAPAEGYGHALGVDGAPAPPMVVRARVETTTEGPAPSTVTARLVLGTCDDAPLPDGRHLLRLSGAGPEGSGRAAQRSGWEASADVLLDVVDGRLRAVPGAVTAEDGETPADLSSLGRGRGLAPVGDGAGLSVTAADPSPAVHAEAGEDEAGAGATAQVTAASEDHGTLPLMTGIVVTRPGDGVIVAGARNAGEHPAAVDGRRGGEHRGDRLDHARHLPRRPLPRRLPRPRLRRHGRRRGRHPRRALRPLGPRGARGRRARGRLSAAATRRLSASPPRRLASSSAVLSSRRPPRRSTGRPGLRPAPRSRTVGASGSADGRARRRRILDVKIVLARDP